MRGWLNMDEVILKMQYLHNKWSQKTRLEKVIDRYLKTCNEIRYSVSSERFYCGFRADFAYLTPVISNQDAFSFVEIEFKRSFDDFKKDFEKEQNGIKKHDLLKNPSFSLSLPYPTQNTPDYFYFAASSLDLCFKIKDDLERKNYVKYGLLVIDEEKEKIQKIKTAKHLHGRAFTPNSNYEKSFFNWFKGRHIPIEGLEGISIPLD